VPATATLGIRMTTPSRIAIKNFIGLSPSTARSKTNAVAPLAPPPAQMASSERCSEHANAAPRSMIA
jgi:hypothetical protein